jgi:hypothetical protein
MYVIDSHDAVLHVEIQSFCFSPNTKPHPIGWFIGCLKFAVEWNIVPVPVQPHSLPLLKSSNTVDNPAIFQGEGNRVDTARLVEVEFSFIPNAASVLPLSRAVSLAHANHRAVMQLGATATDAPRRMMVSR